jgi:hypothetical protein
MSQFNYPFSFDDDTPNKIQGSLELSEPLPYQNQTGGGFFRTGRLTVKEIPPLEIVFYHNAAPLNSFMCVTASWMPT